MTPTIYNVDALDMLQVVDPDSVDLIVTSPPYNVGKKYDAKAEDDFLDYGEYLEWTEDWMSAAYKVAKPDGRMCVNVALDTNKGGRRPLSADITAAALNVGWQYHATIIWDEGTISRRTAWGSFRSASAPHIIAPVETIIVLYKDVWKKQTKGLSTLTKEEFIEWVLGKWAFRGESAKRIGHDAPFPRELPRRLINLLSYKGDTVLDPFLGSGTTMIEAVAGERHAVGTEISPWYASLARDRVVNEVGVDAGIIRIPRKER